MTDRSRTPEISPHFVVKGARDAIAFYKEAFGAEELYVLTDPSDGRIGHAELRLGGLTIMLSDEYPDFGALSPETLGGSPVKMHIYVDDVDEAFPAAIQLGATEVRPIRDQFYGDRSGTLVDPFGHTWTIATQKEEIPPDEMQKRWNASMRA